MPIIGLTDRSPSFKEIGRLRLGIPKSEMTKGPQEIGWFRADFRPDAQDAAAEFLRIYKEHPTSINFRLPFAEISRCWDAYYEVYNKFGLLGMADGKRWLYLRHNKTGELLVKDGVPAHADGTQADDDGVVYLPFNPKVPVYTYTSKKGEDVKVYARPTGRLRVVIPELKRAAYVQIITNSLYNVIHISEQLAGVADMAKQAGMTLPQVPMTLTRRKETISVSFGGQKMMQDHYMLNIEIDPLWMEAQFNYLNSLKPGTVVQLPQLPLVSEVIQRDIAPEDLSEAGSDSGPEYDLDEQDGEPPIPQQSTIIPMTLEEAQERLTPGGKRYESLTDEQLNKVATASAAHFDEPGYADNILACQTILKARHPETPAA